MKPILNIFSRKKLKIKKSEKQKIIIDYREKNSLVASVLVSLGAEIEFKELKIGDYIVKDVVIERKTVFDFISSMKNKRLINQLESLQQYKKKILIIEGVDEQELYNDSEDEERVQFHRKELGTAPPQLKGRSKKRASEISMFPKGKTVGYFHGMHPNAIRGFLLSIILNYNVPIIFAKNSEDTAKFIFILSKKQSKEASLNVVKKTLDKKERMQFIVEGFSGIGPKTSKKLLKKFKTIKNIINSSQEELKEVVGKRAGIFKIAEENY